MRRFRFKLTFIFILILALTVAGLGLFTVKNLQDTHLEALQDSLQQQIELILATVAWPVEGSMAGRQAYFEARASELKLSEETRITFIAQDGTVLGDSDHMAREMDNHATRPEVVEAREANGWGYSIRYSETVEQDMLYVAYEVQQHGETIGYVRKSVTLESIEQAINRLWLYYIVGVGILFLFSILISYRTAKGLTRPLEHITRVARQITDGNYDARVKYNSKDEIGELSNAINTMARSLQDQMQRIAENEERLSSVLENLISGVVMIDGAGRIVLINKFAEYILGVSGKRLLHKPYETVREKQYEFAEIVKESMEKKELIRDEMILHYPQERILDMNVVPLSQGANLWSGVVVVMHDITAIRRLERMRSEFVANVSHELKTPITSIKGFAETLLNGAIDDRETADSFLRIIYDESERLNRLIIDILELSKIESKHSALQCSPVDLSELVHRLIHLIKSDASKKQIELQLDMEEDLFIEGDEDRLRQVFINLISNAINYTPEGGKVLIEARSLHISEEFAEDRVLIRIKDTGIGIPKKDLPRIFERFYRVDKARSRRSGGTGLGLSIVKHIVELHHGDISVESEAGIGTTFSIELPVIQ